MNAVEEKAQEFRYAQSEIDDILADCFNNTGLFAKVFFPDHFNLTFSKDHKDIIKLLDGDDQRIVIVAPRGVGKSSLLALAYPAKLICYREKNFISILAHTATQAERSATNLKRELLTNPNIQAVFGDMKGKPVNRYIREEFSSKAWSTSPMYKDGDLIHGGTLVLPRGWGQEVRGIKHGRFRYDLMIFDDVEGTEEVMSEDQRKKLKNWFEADCVPAVQKARTKAPGEFQWRILFNGTLLHEDSQLANLLEHSKWKKHHFELCDDNLKSTWVEFMSDDDIKDVYDEYEENNNISAFNREYRGIPISDETRKFKKEFFHYYEQTEVAKTAGLETIIIVDPARTTEEASNDTAIICWSLDAFSGYLYVRDLIVGKFEPDDIYKLTAQMATQFGAGTIGIEATGLGEFLIQPFENFLIHWGYNFDFIPLKSKGMKNEKINRIASLIPYYRQGRIKHNRACCGILEQQLLNFPFSKMDDAMDAAAYVVEMLDLGDRFFSPIDANDDESIEDKFLSLEATYSRPIHTEVGWDEFDTSEDVLDNQLTYMEV